MVRDGMTRFVVAKHGGRGSESHAISEFLEAWNANDGRQLGRLYRRLRSPDASADALAILGCHAIAREAYLEAAQTLQDAYRRYVDEWSQWGRTAARPHVCTRLQDASQSLQQLRSSLPAYPGIAWLEALVAACLGAEQKASSVLQTASVEGVPKWFACYLRMLSSDLARAADLPRRSTENAWHAEQIKALPCPLLDSDEDPPECRAARTLDAPRRPAHPESCLGSRWASCSFFRRQLDAYLHGRCARPDAAVFGRDGQAALQAGQCERAASLAIEGLRLDPLNPELSLLLATALCRTHRHVEAYEQCAIAAELQPDQAHVTGMLAALALEMGKRELAQHFVSAGLSKHPSYGGLLKTQGDILRGQGRQADSVGYYVQACRAEPDNDEFRWALIDVLIWLGRTDEAHDQIGLIRCREQNDPRRSALLNALADLKADHAAWRQTAESKLTKLGSPTQAPSRRPDDSVIAEYACHLLVLGRRAEFETLAQDLAKHPPPSPLLQLVEASRLYFGRQTTDDLTQAVQQWEAGLQGAPENALLDAAFGPLLIRALRQLGQPDRALARAMLLAEKQPDNDAFVALVPSLMSQLGKPQREIEEAIQDLQWRCQKEHLVAAASLAVVPLLLTALLPSAFWSRALVPLIVTGASTALVGTVIVRQVPKFCRSMLASCLMGLGVLANSLAVCVWFDGVFGRVAGIVWYSLLAMIPGTLVAMMGAAEQHGLGEALTAARRVPWCMKRLVRKFTSLFRRKSP